MHDEQHYTMTSDQLDDLATMVSILIFKSSEKVLTAERAHADAKKLIMMFIGKRDAR